VGIYAGSGRLVVNHNRIHGFRQYPIVLDQAVIASEGEDLVYPDGGNCRPLANWAPRCLPLEQMPYELTVEDAEPDWGVHGAIPMMALAGPPGEGMVVDRTRTKGISVGINAGVTFGVTTQRDGRPPVEDSKRIGAGVDVGGDIIQRDKLGGGGGGERGGRDERGGRGADVGLFGRGPDVGVDVGVTGSHGRRADAPQDLRGGAAATGATTRGARPDNGQGAGPPNGAPPPNGAGPPNGAPPNNGPPPTP
jgi:hypothetical protein